MKWLKHLLRLLFTLLPVLSFAQYKQVSFSTTPATSYVLMPDSLARYLTAGYETDADKVYAIFTWITDNIEYNVKRYRNISAYQQSTPDDDTGALKPLDERIAIEVLKKRRAFCDGYARLFKTLCDYAGIRSEIVTGYANGGYNSRSFISNHRWNAVYFDSTWHLLDATFASGYVTFADEFVRHYNSQYYLTAPSKFARDHFPEDLQWALTNKPYIPGEFRRSPFKTSAFHKYNITSFKPAQGIIEAMPGDTVVIEIETAGKQKQLFLIDSTVADSAVIASVADTVKAACKVRGKRMVCNYVVTSPKAEWLTVIYNDEPILRYKLKVKSDINEERVKAKSNVAVSPPAL